MRRDDVRWRDEPDAMQDSAMRTARRKQPRLLATCPRPVTPDGLAGLAGIFTCPPELW
jgi:hypothetical protein